jgi:hypothetical protein
LQKAAHLDVPAEAVDAEWEALGITVSPPTSVGAEGVRARDQGPGISAVAFRDSLIAVHSKCA